jgi:hypothetical protein
MSNGVEPILVIKQQIVVLPSVEPTVAQGVHVVVKVRYNELRLNQQSGNIIRGVSKDWNRGIHSVNIIPRPNIQRCVYCH